MTYELPYSKMEYHVGCFEWSQDEWNTVFEGEVTTTERNGRYMGIVGNALSGTANMIKVTFDGTEYECPIATSPMIHYGATPTENGIDFSEYPFLLAFSDADENTTFFTETAGTYTLKIEEQSGGEEPK